MFARGHTEVLPTMQGIPDLSIIEMGCCKKEAIKLATKSAKEMHLCTFIKTKCGCIHRTNFDFTEWTAIHKCAPCTCGSSYLDDKFHAGKSMCEPCSNIRAETF